MPPTKIGRYEVKEQIGRGGMASVFRAFDPTIEREVAIKTLPPEFLRSPGFRERFEQEAKTIAALEHDAIVPVYDSGEANGQPYLVMRLMAGGSLAARLDQGPLSLTEAVTIIERVGMALSAAHARGLIHRDIKPSNFLVDEQGNVYVSDFGLARLAESSAGQTGSAVIGTPAYMAPEMSQPGGLTPLVDIYAAGASLFEMLTGRRPYEADTPMGVMLAHHVEPIPNLSDLRPDLPEGAQAVIARALAKDPSQRYQSMAELVRDLRRAANSAATEPLGLREGGAGGGLDAGTLPASLLTLPAAPAGRTRAGAASARTWIGWAILAAAVVAVSAMLLPGLLAPRAGSEAAAPTSTTPPTDAPTRTSSPSPTVAADIPSLQAFGPVTVKAPGSQIAQPITGPRDISPGDTAQTGTDGVAILTFAPGLYVELQPGAVLRLVSVERDGAGLAITLEQSAGTTFHQLAPEAEGVVKLYQLLTPAGVVTASDARFWASDTGEGWLFKVMEGGLTVDAGEADQDTGDDRLVEAGDAPCVLAQPGEAFAPCDLVEALLVELTDGSELRPTQTPTATVVVTIATNPPIEPPTSTTAPSPTPDLASGPSETPAFCGECKGRPWSYPIGPGQCAFSCATNYPQSPNCCLYEYFDDCGQPCGFVSGCDFRACP